MNFSAITVLIAIASILITVVTVIISALFSIRHKSALVAKAENERDEAKKAVDDTDEARLLRKQLKELVEESTRAKELIRNAEGLQEFLKQKTVLEAERAALEKVIAEKGASVQSLSEKQQALERVVMQIRGLEAELLPLEKAVKDANTTKEELENQIRELQPKEQELRDQLAQIKGQIEEANKSKSELNNEIKKLTEELGKLEKQHENMKTQIHDAEAAEARVKLANQQVDAAMKTLESLQHQTDSLVRMQEQGQVALRQAAFSDLKTRPVFERPQEATQFNSEEEALATFKNHILAKKFKISDRVLYAFHTSLKTSDISSLTVMAGVSGTGKSALPAIYSRAMGIHMVTMAVEPRWDSPRDLLGFFNYVTNRYESTPLARSLFQFQGWSSNEFKPDSDLSDYMLMVLLDEMNLARIEYYFSEFLSKLELRRGGDMANALHRKAVALEIFPGAKGETKNDKEGFDESSIQLFANYNTLFVGTMNEDETTQSLSDKVIDRANVLHFGRPLKLAAQAGAVNLPASPMMRRDTWDKHWLKSVHEGEIEENGRFYVAHKMLEELNEILGDIGRPFAHRTHKAILAYLANYPYAAAGTDETMPEFFKLPLADQIGMRIMPKLRGLDLGMYHDPLTRVSQVLNEIGDNTLTSAFDRAKDNARNKTGFFQWSGMEWTSDVGH